MIAPKKIGAGIPAGIEMDLLLQRAKKKLSQLRRGTIWNLTKGASG